MTVRRGTRLVTMSALVCISVATAASGSPSAAGSTEANDCATTPPATAPPEAGTGLRFGVTAAGQVLSTPAVPDDPPRTLAALEELRQQRPFLVRLNRVLYSKGDDAIADAARRARSFTRKGYLVSLQLRYGDLKFEDGTPEGYAAWLRRAVAKLGPNRRVVGYEVTNEANLAGAPDNSDGLFEEAPRAMAEGVAAVAEEAEQRGFDHVSVGFNWYYEVPQSDDDRFWDALKPYSDELAASLDWVGMTTYPGTYDATPTPLGLEGRKIIEGLNLLRACRLPSLGIGAEVPIRIMENGYPTGFGKPPALQAGALERMVQAVYDHSGTYNVTDYNWFTLRDADTTGSPPSPANVYGLLETDYDKKPAFDVYARLISELSI